MLPRRATLQTRAGPIEHICSGAGRPCWLLFSGAGVPLEGWEPLYPGIEALGTVLAWNRLGSGRSGPPTRPQTGSAVLAPLRELLRYVAVPPPYVLVGHSLGAVHAQLFARLYPREVQALLLLAPSSPGQQDRWRASADRLAQTLSRVMAVPAGRLQGNLEAEVAQARETSLQCDAAGAFPAVPLWIASADGAVARWLGGEAARRQQDAHLAQLERLSPHARRLRLPGAGHFPQRSDPAGVLALMRELAAQLPAAQPFSR